MAKRITKENKKLFRKAKRYLVGGVDSPVRSFSYVGGEPILIERGNGPRVYDYDGNEYIDYVLSWGAMILGHRQRDVVRSVKKAADRGFAFGTTNEAEVELAAIIKGAIPQIGKIRFTNSGTEAVMGAVRLARGYTGRDKIIKFENAYHGHADYLLAKGGSGLATLGMPSSAGVPKGFTKDTIIAPPNDIESIEVIFKRYGREIAAVLVEPVGGNFGVAPPNITFLRRLRALSARYGALLIFDEVITGFRFSFGSAAQAFGIIPDLIVLGKIIGGGLPIGAYGGGDKIMNHLAPLGKVYQASTFSGNPVVMQAGVSTLTVLRKLERGYDHLRDNAAYLARSLRRAAELREIDLEVKQFASMFSVKFRDKKLFPIFYRNLLRQGVYFAPSEFESNFLSFAHTKEDIGKTVSRLAAALAHVSSDI